MREHAYRKELETRRGCISPTRTGLLCLATIGLVLEAGLQVFKLTFFDLFPTWTHYFSVVSAMVLLWVVHSRLYQARTQRADPTRISTTRLSLLWTAMGWATGVSAYYAVWMLPTAPHLVIACLLIVGLFGLAPYWALGCAISQCLELRSLSRRRGLSQMRIAICFVGALAIFPGWFGYQHWSFEQSLALARSDRPRDRVQGLRELRTYSYSPRKLSTARRARPVSYTHLTLPTIYSV